MAYITGSVIDSFGVLPFSLSAGTQLSMSIQNLLPGVSYYGLETVPDGNGFYNPTTPRNLSGSFILGSGIVDVVYDDYKMVAAVAPGGGTLTYTPAVAIMVDTLRTRGTGASLGPVDFSTLLASSYSKRVTIAGGYVESPDSITAAIAATPMLKDASFLYVPSGYAEGTAFSELSTNDYGDLTWTRASDAFRTNASGLIQRVPWNLLQRSEEFANTTWLKTNISITANTTTSPNGTLTADTLSIGVDASSQRHRLAQTQTITIGTTYTGTYYLKANQHQWIQIVAVSGFSVGVWANFDLVNGTIGNTGGVDTTASIENVGNGWYRCRVSGVATGTSSTGFEILTTNNTNSGRYPSYQSLVAEDVCYVWGAQLVEGSSAETYLATTDRLNVPRLSYMYGSCPSVLLEPQRTNLFLQSEAFDNASWTKTSTSITANSTTSPDGTTNADTFTANGVSTFHIIEQSFNIVSGTNYAFSVYAKKNTNNFFQIIGGSSNFGLNAWANFDLNNGVVGSVGSSTTASIVNVGNGWYRCVMVAQGTTTLAGTSAFGIISSSTAGRGETNALSTSVFLWGAQLEAGAYPTSYIPSTSATATRVVDVFTRNNIYTNGLITSSGGTWFVELDNNISLIRDASSNLFIGTTNNGNTNTSLGIRNNGATAQRLSVYKRSSGTLTQLYLTLTDTIKVAIKWNGTSADVFVNGVKVNSATAFTTTNMEFLQGDGLDVPKYMKQMALYPSPLSDTDCTTLTTL